MSPSVGRWNSQKWFYCPRSVLNLDLNTQISNYLELWPRLHVNVADIIMGSDHLMLDLEEWSLVLNKMLKWVVFGIFVKIFLHFSIVKLRLILNSKYRQAWLSLVSSSNDFQMTFAFELWVSEDNFWRASHPHSPPWIKTETTLDHTWLILTLPEAIRPY